MAYGFIGPGHSTPGELRDAVQPSLGTAIGQALGGAAMNFAGAFKQRRDQAQREASALRLARMKGAGKGGITEYQSESLRLRRKADVRAESEERRKGKKFVPLQESRILGVRGAKRDEKAKAAKARVTELVSDYQVRLQARGLDAKVLDVERTVAAQLAANPKMGEAGIREVLDSEVKAKIKGYLAKRREKISDKTKTDKMPPENLSRLNKLLDWYGSFLKAGTLTREPNMFAQFTASLGPLKFSDEQMKKLYGNANGYTVLSNAAYTAAKYGFNLKEMEAREPEAFGVLGKKLEDWTIAAGVPAPNNKPWQRSKLFSLAGLTY